MNASLRNCVRMAIFCGAFALASGAHADTATVRGYWLEPSGSVLRIAPCADKLCIQIIALSQGSHPQTDVHNPVVSLRPRSLCGLRIGEGFVEKDPQHAEGGHIYDPKTGRTYSGSMMAEGALLKLRGFVGVKLFGRTETWTRALHVPPCGVE